jgi:hypothetical protein
MYERGDGLGTNGSSFDWGGLVSGVLETGAQITGSALEYQSGVEQRRAEAAARREAAAAEAAAAAARRESEAAAAQRQFELQMERIRALREAGQESAARALEERAPAVAAAASGTSPLVWVAVAVLGAGAVGAIVWGVTRKGSKD